MTGTPEPEEPRSCRRARGRQDMAWKPRARRAVSVPASLDDHSARRRPGTAGRGGGMVSDRTKGWCGRPERSGRAGQVTHSQQRGGQLFRYTLEIEDVV